MESLRQDIRFGVRTLAKNPGFTAIAVLALALGIGANTAIFSVVHAVLLRPLPYPQAERIVVPATVFERYNSDRGSVSFADYLDIKAQTDLFDAVAVFQEGSADLTGGDAPERLQIARVSSGFFEALGLASQIGRTFIASEHTNPASNVMLISHDLWMRRFGGDPKVLGARVEVSGAAWEVIGVMPKELRWPTRHRGLVAPVGQRCSAGGFDAP